MDKIVSTTVYSAEMVINTIVERFGANPTDVSSATAMDVVATVNLLDEDTAIGTLLDV